MWNRYGSIAFEFALLGPLNGCSFCCSLQNSISTVKSLSSYLNHLTAQGVVFLIDNLNHFLLDFFFVKFERKQLMTYLALNLAIFEIWQFIMTVQVFSKKDPFKKS